MEYFFTAISSLGLPNFVTHLGLHAIKLTKFRSVAVHKNDDEGTLLRQYHSVQQNVEPDHNRIAAERTMATAAW